MDKSIMNKKAALFFCTAFLFATLPAHAQTWRAGLADSSMTAQSGGADLPIISFQPDISFDPSYPMGARFNFSANLYLAFFGQGVDATTRNMLQQSPPTGMGTTDAASPGAGTFTSTSIATTGEGQYTANGTFTLNGNTHPMQVPFTVAPNGKNLVIQGTFSFSPAEYAGAKLPTAIQNEITGNFTFVETR